MWFWLACAPDTPKPVDTAATPTGLPAVAVIHVTTEDGVTLEADYYAADPGAPAVLLLHMSPLNGYDRTVWPPAFIGDVRAPRHLALRAIRRERARRADPARQPHRRRRHPGVGPRRGGARRVRGRLSGSAGLSVADR